MHIVFRGLKYFAPEFVDAAKKVPYQRASTVTKDSTANGAGSSKQGSSSSSKFFEEALNAAKEVDEGDNRPTQVEYADTESEEEDNGRAQIEYADTESENEFESQAQVWDSAKVLSSAI